MIVYRCEDSLESIFTAIYNSYEEKRVVSDTCLSLDGENYLFAEYVPVTPDPEKTAKVMRTLRRRFGEKDVWGICFALSAQDEAKAQAVYRTVAAGLAGNCAAGHLFDNLADADIRKAFSLQRNAQREYQHLQGFVRFSELENGMLYARIAPKNHLIPFLTPHFADRFPEENFVLYDEGRRVYGVHPAAGEWYLMQRGEEADENPGMENGMLLSQAETGYRELFCQFCETIAIQERWNPKLQQNLLPLRFREYMTEFQ